jgi:hypothetical protein
VEDIINANVVDDNIGQAPHPPSLGPAGPLGSTDEAQGGS